MSEFKPKIYTIFREGYSFQTFKEDLLAGFTVAVIAIPLAMGFAIASGTTPEKGLYTAIVAGLLVSLLGGSRVQIGGPTGAFVVMIYAILGRTGYSGLCLSTLLAGVFLIGMGLFRLGNWMRFVPHSLIVGLTMALATSIFSSQVKPFLGLQLDKEPAHFFSKWMAYLSAFDTLHLPTFFLGSFTLCSILLLRRFAPRIPWGIASIILGALLTTFFDLNVATVFSRFGHLPRILPTPTFSFAMPNASVLRITLDAIAIALLGGMESLLSATIGDRMSGGKHRPNCELIAQGIANIGSIVFGGIPATGAIARTAVNVRSGAKTPVAGVCHALMLAMILWGFAPIVGKIPLASLAAVLIMVAWNMSEAKEFSTLLKGKFSERAILLCTFFLTLFVDIVAGIFGGMLLFFLLKKVASARAL